jgi:hypothetical protein
MKPYLLAAVAFVLLTACGKDNVNDDSRLVLQKKIHGRYKLTSCQSNQPLDLNNDGIASVNLTLENSMILMAEVELKVVIPDICLKDNEFAFSETWPAETKFRLDTNEHIPCPVPPIYNSYYDIFCTANIGCIDKDFKSVRLLNDIKPSSNGTLVSIESITFDDDKVVRITSMRRFYTNKNGWVTATVESTYKHYTSAC